MKPKRVSHVVTLAIILAVFCSKSIAEIDKPRITFAYQLNESFPYQMGNGVEVADPPGIAIDILKSAAEKLNLEFEFNRYPNKRVHLLLQNGEVDGAFMFSFKQDRLNIGMYPWKDGRVDSTKRIASLTYSLYVLEGSDVQWDGEKFHNVDGTIAAGAGNSIVSLLKDQGHSVIEVPTVKSGLLMLQAGRVIAIAAQGAKVDPVLQSTGFGNIKKIPVPLTSKDYYLMLSKQFVARDPLLAEQLWQAIGDVRDSVFKDALTNYVQ